MCAMSFFLCVWEIFFTIHCSLIIFTAWGKRHFHCQTREREGKTVHWHGKIRRERVCAFEWPYCPPVCPSRQTARQTDRQDNTTWKSGSEGRDESEEVRVRGLLSDRIMRGERKKMQTDGGKWMIDNCLWKEKTLAIFVYVYDACIPVGCCWFTTMLLCHGNNLGEEKW